MAVANVNRYQHEKSPSDERGFDTDAIGHR
jgi:hypothetical protein